MGSLRAAARTQKAGEARPRTNAESCSYGSSHYSKRFVARRKIPRVLGHVICLPRPDACNSHLHPTPAPISYQDAMHLSRIWHMALVSVSRIWHRPFLSTACGIARHVAYASLARHVAYASPYHLPHELKWVHIHAHVLCALLSTCLCSA